MPKNAQTTAQLHSSHMLESNDQNSPSQASTVREPWTSRCSSWIEKWQRNRRQIANMRWIIEKAREFQKNIYFCFIDYAKAFVWITTNCGKFLEIGIREHLTCLLRNLYAGQAATVRTRHGTTEWNTFTFHVKAVYCHPAYLTYMQSTSIEIPCWMNHRLESRLWEEI